MATNIFNYDGTKLTTVPDGRIDSTSASIRFPGDGYLNYGEAVNENMLWIMQNFASSAPPSAPVKGQSWFDTSINLLKIYDGLAWKEVGRIVVQNTVPDPPSSIGTLWFDNAKQQLHAWTGTAWRLIGPLGSINNSDPINPAIPQNSSIDAMLIGDGTSNRPAWRITVAGTVLAILSKESSYIPNPAIPGFSSIKPGLNFNSTIAGMSITGDLSLFANDQDNIPLSSNVFTLGNESYRFSSVHAENFFGKATSAANADAATASQSSLISQNSNQLGGVNASIYLRSDLDVVPNTYNTKDIGTTSRQWRTIYAGNLLLNGIPVYAGGVANIVGTANQVTVAGTSNVVLGLPQSIGTNNSPRFSSIGLSSNAGAAGSVTFGDGTVQTTASGSARSFNLNVAVPTSNLSLAVGNKLILSFTNLVNIPLYTSCVQGTYRVLFTCTDTNSQNIELQWYPNSTTTPVALTDSFEATSILINTASGSISPAPLANSVNKVGAFWFDFVAGMADAVSGRGPFMTEFTVSTYTAAKMIKASTTVALGTGINTGMWLNGVGAGSGSARLNTSTPWTSLGVIRMDPTSSVGQLMSGVITIERIS
jgi:hypothetical protein